MHRGPLSELIDGTAGLHDSHQDQGSYTGHHDVELDVRLHTIITTGLTAVSFSGSSLA